MRVPASGSLDLGSEMTVSAWIRPTVSQDGWRAIVQRQADAYLLHASSTFSAPAWRLDHAIAALVVVAAVCLVVATVLSRGWWIGERRRSWRWAVGLFVAGCVLDLFFAPSGTVFGPLLLAAWFAATATRRTEAIVGWLLVVGLGLVVVEAFTDVAELRDRLEYNQGGGTRAAALGVTLVVCGLLRLRSTPNDRRPA